MVIPIPTRSVRQVTRSRTAPPVKLKSVLRYAIAMPRDRRIRRAGGTRRAAVLEIAAKVLAERGYENTRYADVSMASGVAVSTLQNYFGSREDMLIETM